MIMQQKDLSHILILKNIRKESLEKFASLVDIICLPQNSCLYSDKQDLHYLYFVLSGKVSISKSNEHGEHKIIFLLGKGEMINHPFMYKNTSAIDCWAFENSEILRISFEDFDKILEQDYTLVKNCMLYMEKRIRRLYRQLKNSTSLSLDKKLAAKLYRLFLEYGLPNEKEGNKILIDLPITITWLAKMLGCQRESLSRAMKSLVSLEIVHYSGKKVFLDPEAAQKLFKS